MFFVEARRMWRHASHPALALVVALTLMSVLVVPGTAEANGKHGVRQLTVMTQNMYVGADLAPVLGATTPDQFVAATASVFATMLSTNFPARANAMADEIAANRPDLIGLQEAVDWTTQGLSPGTTPPSFDFVAILQAALASRGLHYDVAVVSNNVSEGPVPLIAPAFGCVVVSPAPDCVVTALDRNAILANHDNPDLRLSDPQTGHYANQEVLTTPIGPLSFDRGWASIDGTLGGKMFRFVTTHLETADFPEVQQAQAQEFLAGPAIAPGTVIAAGDFNSPADGSSTTSYADLTRSYFTDSFVARSRNPGYTCCQNGTLSNPASLFDRRIDLILTHGASRASCASAPRLVGAMPFESVVPLWPSDHAGLVATVRLS